jgi:putative ABC transport system permease protein
VTFAQLALSNLKGSWLRYAAFLLSSTFSVALFFVYAQFLYHPDLEAGYLYGGQATRTVLTVCLVLIAVFAFFFVLYSSGAFMRARNKEFGLLTLMGTTRGQLRRLIWLENTFLSLAAIAAGVGLGLLFSRLFLMAIARVLLIDEPLSFVVVPRALLMTALGFFLLFQLVTLAGAGAVGRRTVLEMLKEASKPRVKPRPKVGLAVLGFLMVAGGYGVAATAQGEAVVMAFVPVVVVVVLGTYLLFTQGSVFGMRRLTRGASYLRGTRMLVVSQLVFRLSDNARLLSNIATLSAVVLAAAGTFYVTSRQFYATIDGQFPHALTFVETSGDGPQLTRSDVDAILASHGVTATVAADLPMVEGRLTSDDGQGWLVLVSEPDYLAWVNALEGPGGLDGAAWLTPLDVTATDGNDRPPAFRLSHEPEPGAVAARHVTPPTAVPPYVSGAWYAVDAGFWEAQARRLGTMTFAVYDWPGSDRSTAVGTAVSMAIPSDYSVLVTNKHAMFVTVRQMLGLSMFAGLFVSVLFFIGAGSLVYFKLFTELPDDRRLFTRLKRVGITRREANAVVSRQVALVFLLPFAVGGVHALFALNALGGLMGTAGPARAAVIGYALTVVGLFGAVQLVFFLLTRWTYLRALLPRY